MTDTTRAELLTEINRAARRLGAKSDLLGLLGCWGERLPNIEVLHGLRRRNDQRGLALGRHDGMSCEAAIKHEIRIAFEQLGAPLDIVAQLTTWRDATDDFETLRDIRRFNHAGSLFDIGSRSVGVLGETKMRSAEASK